MPKKPSALPCSWGGEGPQQEGAAQRQGDTTAEALEGAGSNQEAQVRGKAAQQRAGEEQRQAAEIGALHAEAVGQEAGQRRGDAQAEHVDANNPLGVAEARAILAAQGLKGDVHDRRVENRHEDTKNDRNEDFPLVGQPAAVCRGRRMRWVAHSFSLLRVYSACLRPRCLNTMQDNGDKLLADLVEGQVVACHNRVVVGAKQALQGVDDEGRAEVGANIALRFGFLDQR